MPVGLPRGKKANAAFSAAVVGAAALVALSCAVLPAQPARASAAAPPSPFAIGLLASGGDGSASPAHQPSATTPAHQLSASPPTVPPTCKNAAQPLLIRDYTGLNQPMHPKVLFFSKPWNHYKYWMSYTPYPGCDARFENPSIAVSNDGIHWQTPPGMRNPVIAAPEGADRGAHLSDPQLVMAGGTMELWFRYNPSDTSSGKKYQTNSHINIIKYCSSRNGVKWTSPRSVLQDSNAYLSPDILFENGVYRIWYTNYDGKMYFRQSVDLSAWTKPLKVNISMPGYNIWHQDMIHGDSGYETVFCAYNNHSGTGQHGMCLYYARSVDGVDFAEPELILAPAQGDTALDNEMIYRSSIVYVDGERKIFYSAMSRELKWHIFLTDLDFDDDAMASLK